MDRRSFFEKSLKNTGFTNSEDLKENDPKPKNKYANKKLPKPYKSGAKGIEPFTGTWTRAEAAHLLNRTLFGYKKEVLDQFEGLTMNDAVDMLLMPTGEPSPPVNSYYKEVPDTEVPDGETWINAPIISPYNIKRLKSLKQWWFGVMLNQPTSLQEKMVLFWHNLFATQSAIVQTPIYVYRHIALLRSHVFGNYKTLTKQVSIDPAMLKYLNGYLNNKYSPDENYARELQELFTLGKGPDSQYTEDDVKEAAKILTGYQVDSTTGLYKFTPNRHDTSDKQFSSFYNNTVITGKSGAAGEDELDELIDMIFAQTEVSKHIMRKLYRFFVYYVIDDEIENKVIAPLAQIFRDNNYEIAPVLETLFKSEHFYDAYNRGCNIKNPLEYTISTIHNFGVVFPDITNIPDYHIALQSYNNYHALMGMDPGDPPNVAGWEAYWSSPVFHEYWINSVTLPYRDLLLELLITPAGYTFQGIATKFDIMEYTKAIPNAEDPNALIDYLVDIMYGVDLTAEQKTSAKSILLSNQLLDHYWTDAWLTYVGNPNSTNYNVVYTRLYPFYKFMFHLVEYQLI